MNMYKVKWTRLETEIFRFLCIRAGMSLNLREIARSLNVSPTAVSNALKNLEKDKTVKVTRSKKMNLFSIELNRDNPATINLKRVENLRLIYESGLYEILYDTFPGCTVILFGSYSNGDDVWTEKTEHRSDIDIAVIGTEKKTIDLTKFNEILEREVNINYYPSWKAIHKNLRENILRGIVLKGSIEL
jgi:predicted nucleotidyltransferase